VTPETWWIGLEPWVLRDGNYADFVTGRRRQFALEFGYSRARRLQLTSAASGSFSQHAGRGAWYDVVGQLLRTGPEFPADDDTFVLDFGLLAYKKWLVLDGSAHPQAGAWLSGEIVLTVDHFEYMDHLAELPGMPPLIYTWAIEEIQLETTPLIQVPHGHPLYPGGPNRGPISVADPSRETWRTVHQTRPWIDRRGYRLKCTLENAAPVN